MNDFLDNPVFNALASGDKERAFGNATAKYFEPEVSPFAGFDVPYEEGFRQLHLMLPNERKILFASRKEIPEPAGWKLIQFIEGTQFLYLSKSGWEEKFSHIIPLEPRHIEQMVDLATLTKPGPFGRRTIEFGHYHGIFAGEKLVAMTGRRLHVHGYTEISAVCTHPDHTGQGYARDLLKHEVTSILKEGQVPFLHVRSDNERAIELYERLGFVKNGGMNFYVLKRTSDLA